MNTLRPALTLSVLGLLAISGCGGSSSSGTKADAVAACKQSCTKTFDLCLSDAGALGASFKPMCEMACSTNETTNTTACTNASAVIAGIKQCQSQTTCNGYTTCLAAAPRCTGGGTGTGGASGTGGAGTGTGGASGTGTGGATGAGTGGASGGGTGGTSGGGATCADLSACCTKIADASTKQICDLQVSTVQSMVTKGTVTQAAADAACGQALSIAKPTYCP